MPTLGTVKSLDRCTSRRTDAAWLAEKGKAPDTRYLVLVDMKLAVGPAGENGPTGLRWLSESEVEPLGLLDDPHTFLGIDASGRAHFSLPITEHRAGSVPGGLKALEPLSDLRPLMVAGQLSIDELAIAGEARALAEWHLNSRCCGHCGSNTDVKDGGWRRRCFACGKEVFPRTDPVVIMLVTHGDTCLISHEPRFKQLQTRMFSALAGFLEPGEDIEHAVRREVLEEVGVRIGAVTYQESQPWPFPHSLMIGCRAEALGNELKLDPAEIEEARWVTREDVRMMLAGRHPEGITLPGKHAIAHKLLTAFAEGR